MNTNLVKFKIAYIQTHHPFIHLRKCELKFSENWTLPFPIFHPQSHLCVSSFISTVHRLLLLQTITLMALPIKNLMRLVGWLKISTNAWCTNKIECFLWYIQIEHVNPAIWHHCQMFIQRVHCTHIPPSTHFSWNPVWTLRQKCVHWLHWEN